MTSDRRRPGAAIAMLAAAAALAACGEGPAPPTGAPLAPAAAAPALPPVRLRARDAAVHSPDPSVAGGTAALLARDPLDAWDRGRALFTREFTAAEGVLGRPIARPVLEDGATPVVPGSRVASCAACHATPFGDGGSGPTIAKNGPTGRNTPHLFGSGLVEMIGAEIRRQILALGDRDGDGIVGIAEADARRATVRASAGSVLDFGSFGDGDGDGAPDLDPVCRIAFVDAAGRVVAGARRLTDPEVAGYDLEVQVFGWGHTLASRAPLSSTLRGFSAAAFNVHQGLQAHDPTLEGDGSGRFVVGSSLAGATQFATGRTPDAGRRRDRGGESLDDPDGDGVADELTEGDMDLLEHYLLHHPAPAERPRGAREERGRAAFEAMGCARCHVPDWTLPAAASTPGAAGDRRAFAIAVEGDATPGALRGRVERPAAKGAAVEVRGVYSDFRRHDLGPAFHQVQFDGSVARSFRTTPLWGVGSTAPYGHDGASLDLDSVIRRHGGAAAVESAAFAAAAEEEREALLAFLRGLVLYSVDDLRCR